MIASPYADDLARIPVREHRARVRGSDTAWWEYGDPEAPVILMVHGFRGDHHGLEPIVAKLPGYRVIVPDLPGFGESSTFAEGAHDIDGYAAWLAEFAATARVADAAAPIGPSGWTLLGHSFGSIIASAAVAGGLAPDDLVLVNPIGAPALEGPRAIMTRLAVGYYRASAALPAKLGFALLRNRAIVRVMSVTMAKTEEPDLRRFIHDQHDQYFSAFSDRDAVLEAFEASVTHDVREYAPSIRVPVLLVVAEQDDVTPLAAQYRLQPLFDDATLAVIDGVGHLIHYETPAEAAGHIRVFLEGERA